MSGRPRNDCRAFWALVMAGLSCALAGCVSEVKPEPAAAMPWRETGVAMKQQPTDESLSEDVRSFYSRLTQEPNAQYELTVSQPEVRIEDDPVAMGLQFPLMFIDIITLSALGLAIPDECKAQATVTVTLKRKGSSEVLDQVVETRAVNGNLRGLMFVRRSGWGGVKDKAATYAKQDAFRNAMRILERHVASGEFGGATAVATAPPPSYSSGTPSATPPPAAAPTGPAGIRNVHVLVVGIGDYKDPSIPKLRYTSADARAVYEFFHGSSRSPARKENVHFLGDTPNEDDLVADRRGINIAINRYLVRAAVNKDDMAILFFAGHGDSGRHPSKGTEYYLIPQDASKEDLFATAIEMSEFQRLWSAIPCQTKLLITDACNSGGFTGIRGVSGTVGVEEAVAGEAQAVFSACRSDEKSMEADDLKHGLFTYVLLKGLEGQADASFGDNDGRVTLSELKKWLDKQVPTEASKHGGKQTPITSLVAAWGEVFLTK